MCGFHNTQSLHPVRTHTCIVIRLNAGHTTHRAVMCIIMHVYVHVFMSDTDVNPHTRKVARVPAVPPLPGWSDNISVNRSPDRENLISLCAALSPQGPGKAITSTVYLSGFVGKWGGRTTGVHQSQNATSGATCLCDRPHHVN